MENKVAAGSRTIYPCGRSVGKSTDILNEPGIYAWELMQRCTNCGHERYTHLEDGACLFEPTQFQAPPPPTFVSFSYTSSGSAADVVDITMNAAPIPAPRPYTRVSRKTFKMPRPPKARR